MVKGYSFDRGFLSSYMANNETKNEAILDKPFVLVTDKKIISMQELLVYLEEAIKEVNHFSLFVMILNKKF